MPATTPPYPRDLIGHGRNPPHAQWPGGARIAVQFVLNYEEGGENCVLHGDAGSEQFLSEMFNPAAFEARHISMEGIYEYGSRAGVWRILREFEQRGLPLTVFGIASAMQRHPELTQALKALGHDLCCHGLKWIHYQHVDEATEREHMAQAMHILTELWGERPLGWYTGRDSPNTRRLVADFGGFAYDSDYYGDDLPFWMKVRRTDGSVVPQLIVPYTLDCNDMRFALPQGYSHADPFFQYMKDTFDALYAEGGRYNRVAATEGLGKNYKLKKVDFKPYPACTNTLAAGESMLALVTLVAFKDTILTLFSQLKLPLDAIADGITRQVREPAARSA